MKWLASSSHFPNIKRAPLPGWNVKCMQSTPGRGKGTRRLHIFGLCVSHGKKQEINCQTSIFRISSLLPFPSGSAVNNLPAMQETWVQAPRDPLEKGMATHSRIFAWNVPRTEEPTGLQPVGLQRVGCH